MVTIFSNVFLRFSLPKKLMKWILELDNYTKEELFTYLEIIISYVACTFLRIYNICFVPPLNFQFYFEVKLFELGTYLNCKDMNCPIKTFLYIRKIYCNNII